MSHTKYDPPAASLEKWRDTAEKQMKGKSVDSLYKNTDEGIKMKELNISIKSLIF